MRRSFFLPACVIAFVLATPEAEPAGAQIAPQYRLVELGNLGRDNFAFRVNERGDVVGSFHTSTDSSGYHAFLYRDGRMTELVPGPYSHAVGVNESGAIAGWGASLGQGYRSWVISGDVRTDIPPPGPYDSYATGINDAGDVVGHSYFTGLAANHPFLFRGGDVIDLGLPADAGGAYATGINNRGEIIGFAAARGANHPVVFRDGNWTYLAPDYVGGGSPTSINDAGEIAGSVYYIDDFLGKPDWVRRAARFRDGMTTLLGPADAESRASDINNHGLVVGSFGPHLNSRAFIDDGNRFVDLNTLLAPGTGWVVTTANGINDAGTIVGAGRNRSGQHRAIMLVPVPEPAGVTVLAGGVVLFRRRRRTVRIPQSVGALRPHARFGRGVLAGGRFTGIEVGSISPKGGAGDTSSCTIVAFMRSARWR
jgi:probable HAF family extracellular repeat protein